MYPIRIANRNRRVIGIARAIMLIGSPLGVITAAVTKTPKIE